MKKPLSTLFMLAALVGGVGLAVFAARSSQEETPMTPVTDASTGRAALRAFYTAPPVIPHEVTSRGNKECLHCHQDIRTIGDRETVISPHTQFQNCQQCHVGRQLLNRAFEAAPLQTSWVGLKEPGLGTRANEFAPPTIPHRYFMRENCNSCHTPEKMNKTLHTPHPERSQCLQCHAFDKKLLF